MRIKVDGEIHQIHWRHESPEFDELLAERGLDRQKAFDFIKNTKGGRQTLARELDVPSIPRNSVTICTITDAEGTVLTTATVSKSKTTPWNKWSRKRACCLSLGKLLKKRWPQTTERVNGKLRIVHTEESLKNRSIRQEIGHIFLSQGKKSVTALAVSNPE
jgi:hypothetical protein